MPRDSLSHESFKKSLSKYKIYINCVFHVLTTLSFPFDLCLYVNQNHFKLVTEDAYPQRIIVACMNRGHAKPLSVVNKFAICCFHFKLI